MELIDFNIPDGTTINEFLKSFLNELVKCDIKDKEAITFIRTLLHVSKSSDKQYFFKGRFGNEFSLRDLIVGKGNLQKLSIGECTFIYGRHQIEPHSVIYRK